MITTPPPTKPPVVMGLIRDWRRAWRFWSIQAMALSVAILGGWEALPDDLKFIVPPRVTHIVALVVLASGILGRIVQQAPAAHGGPGDTQ